MSWGVVTTLQRQSDRCLAKVTQKQQGTGVGHLESSFVLWVHAENR